MTTTRKTLCAIYAAIAAVALVTTWTHATDDPGLKALDIILLVVFTAVAGAGVVFTASN